MAALKSRAKKPPMIDGGGPLQRGWKDKAVTQEYEGRAKRAVREAMKAAGVTYPELGARLRRLGVEITDAALENKISRGGFSAAFYLQCLDALGASH
jgi:hypothetical protein